MTLLFRLTIPYRTAFTEPLTHVTKDLPFLAICLIFNGFLWKRYGTEVTQNTSTKEVEAENYT
jgi:hypothetical protein